MVESKNTKPKYKVKRGGYTEWQLEKLRVAIATYRIRGTVDGQEFSISDLAWDIESSRPESRADEKNDKNYFIKIERLRRFIAGESTPDFTKLELIKTFLISAGELTEKELDKANDDINEALPFLKSVSAIKAKNSMSSLEGIFSNKVGDKNFGELKIQFIDDPSGLFARVTEAAKRKSKSVLFATEEVFKKDGDEFILSFRRGYAFVLGKNKTLHVFLKSYIPEDQVSYVEVVDKQSKFASSEWLYLMRSSETWFLSPLSNMLLEEIAEEAIDDQGSRFNIGYYERVAVRKSVSEEKGET